MSANIQQILNQKIIYLYFLDKTIKKIAKNEFSDLKYLKKKNLHVIFYWFTSTH